MTAQLAHYKGAPLRGVACVARRGNRIALIRNRKRGGSIEIPCGKLEPGEDPAVGAARELLEEAGIRAKTPPVYVTTKDMGHYQVDVFAVEVTEGEPFPGDDASEAWWGEPEELLRGRHPEDYPLVIRAFALLGAE